MDAAAHCDALLRQRDEDRWLAARYAPPPLRRRLTALYAFHGELRSIPGRVTEPALGEIRVQWHRDALAELRDGKRPRAHPVIEEVAAADIADAAFDQWIDAAIDAAARPLYGEGFADTEKFLSWLSQAEGAIDAAAVAICGGDETLCAVVQEVGAAFAAAREGAVLAPDTDYKAQAAAVWKRAAPVFRVAPDECAPAMAHLFLTPVYLKRGAGMFPLVKRLKIFSAIAFAR